MSRNPLVYEIHGTRVTVDWNDWGQDTDYGIGPIDGYRIYYGKTGQHLQQHVDSSNSFQSIANLLPDTSYDFAIAVLKTLDGTETVGDISNRVSASTGCIGTLILTLK